MQTLRTYFSFAGRANTIHSLQLLFALLLVVTLPFSRPANSAAVVGLVAVWLASGNWAHKWAVLRTSRLLWVFCGFYLLNLLSLLWTSNLTMAMGELERKLSLLLLPLVFATGVRFTRKQIALVLKFFLLALLIASLYCHIHALVRLANDTRPWSAFFGGWYTYSYLVAPIHINPTYFSMYLVVGLAGIGWLWQHDGFVQRALKGWGWLPLVYLFFFLIHLGARMGILVFLALAAVMVVRYFWKRGNKRAVALGLLAIVAAGLVSTLGFERNRQRFSRLIYGDERLKGKNELRQRDTRLAIWYSAGQVVAENPLIGTGIGDVPEALNATYLKNDFPHGANENLNAHNQFLDAQLGMGISGFLLLFLGLLVPLRRRIGAAPVLYGLFAATVLLSCLTENILDTQKGVVFYAFFNAMLAFSTAGD